MGSIRSTDVVGAIVRPVLVGLSGGALQDRLLVSNRPKDAVIMGSRVTTGRGLAVDDGVSILNLTTRHAPTTATTMSRLKVARGSRRTRAVVARFLPRPDGLFRSLTRTFAEVIGERFRAVRRKRLVAHPRVHRSWSLRHRPQLTGSSR